MKQSLEVDSIEEKGSQAQARDLALWKSQQGLKTRAKEERQLQQ